MSSAVSPVPHRAMILCAGLGERLRPLTEELPKPLVPVGDRSVLAHIAARLARGGYRSAVANTHWLANKFDKAINSLDLDLTLVHEPRIRGVAGGVAGARALLGAPVVCWNGDILIDDPPLEELVARVTASGGVCLAVAPSAETGTVGLDGSGRQLVRVRGQRFGVEVRQGDYVGLFALGEAALAELPEQGCLIGDYCLPRLRRGEPIETCLMSSPWQEVGSLAGYLDANVRWLSHHANHAERSYVQPGALVEPGVQLSDSVVCTGARLEGAGGVERAVIWPGARAVAPFARGVWTARSKAQL